jgi:hypothetical protein
MKRAAALSITALFALHPMAAVAAVCKQEDAIYGDRDGAYELGFEAVDSEAASSSYRFVVSVKNTDVRLDGFVMGSEPVNRPSGILFHNCPEGDTTGEEIRKCTVWEGVIYSATSGRIDLLPMTGSPAASEILLPGFALALVDSTAWGKDKATVVPWEVLSLKRCRT